MPATPRVIVYPADMGRCGHRLIWPARALADQGADVTVVTAEDPPEAQLQAQWGTLLDGTRVLVDVEVPDADVVVFQRPLQRTLVEAIPRLQDAGVRVVVEIDDDFTAMSRRNVAWYSCQPTAYEHPVTKAVMGGPDRNWHHLAHACRIADLVTVSTPALAQRYGKHGRVRVVPNHIPASYLDVRPEPHDGVVVGWTGSVDTHPDDLQVTRGAVGRALRATGASFAVVGTGNGVQRRLGLDQPVVASGWLPLDQYPHAVAQFDVGIVPLELSAFNEAKSALKGLEYAALGVPFVASPTEPYCTLDMTMIGRLAMRPRHWERELRWLIENPEARDESASRGREAVRERWTVEGNCEQWFDAWSGVVNTVCA
jgi:glycosyltransferase involved in cell wall biosynthesis